jgi:hypothetical protein
MLLAMNVRPLIEHIFSKFHLNSQNISGFEVRRQLGNSYRPQGRAGYSELVGELSMFDQRLYGKIQVL